MKELRDAPPRLDFGHFVDRLFWSLITAAALYAATQMRGLSASVEELNKSMAVVLYQLTESREHLQHVDERIERLEERRRR